MIKKKKTPKSTFLNSIVGCLKIAYCSLVAFGSQCNAGSVHLNFCCYLLCIHQQNKYFAVIV